MSAPMLTLRPEGLPKLRALEVDLAKTKRENESLERDVRRLRNEVRELRDNPKAMERIARDQLGFVKSNEIVFQFGRMQ